MHNSAINVLLLNKEFNFLRLWQFVNYVSCWHLKGSLGLTRGTIKLALHNTTVLENVCRNLITDMRNCWYNIKTE
jgi:hypothetical protein